MGNKPISEAHGEWMLLALPSDGQREPWMVEGKIYPVILRHTSTFLPQKPDVVVLDPKTRMELITLSWNDACEMFGI